MPPRCCRPGGIIHPDKIRLMEILDTMMPGQLPDDARVFGGDPTTGIQWRVVDYSGRKVLVTCRYPIAYVLLHATDLSLFPAHDGEPAVLVPGTVVF